MYILKDNIYIIHILVYEFLSNYEIYDTMNETIVHFHVTCLVNDDWSGRA